MNVLQALNPSSQAGKPNQMPGAGQQGQGPNFQQIAQIAMQAIQQIAQLARSGQNDNGMSQGDRQQASRAVQGVGQNRTGAEQQFA